MLKILLVLVLLLFIQQIYNHSFNDLMLDDYRYGCVPNDNPCCPENQYNIFQTIDKVADDITCDSIDFLFSHTWLVNATEECREQYRKSYCVLSIPECCSPTNPAVFRPCRTLCYEIFDICDEFSFPGSDHLCDDDTTWFDEPCNDGTGSC
eukprot:TRINITY_DN841_c0_g1_i1.p1 TRINITY_DN841_c0_g1~~TRINITY_DN841_c0_g1_i1.p1  ORF type:complete len:151 (+),score=19.27 TRINITY_DN841_c0_g1_i1:48-500(+)